MSLIAALFADKLRKEKLRQLEEQKREVQGLLGATPKEQVLGGMPDSMLGDRMQVQLQPQDMGSGYLGSQQTPQDTARFVADVQGAGYSPQQTQSLLSPLAAKEPQKPTSFMLDFEAYQKADDETKKSMLDYRRSGAQSINVGTNMKPPSGYRFANPNDPQSSPVEPIPGGPATRGTGAQQKKIAAFEGIRGMVNAMQQGLKDGVDPNSLNTTITGMLKGVPILAGMWESFNGDAKEQAKFLNESENFGNTALQIMRGAQVGPAEQERFERSLPTSGMTTAQYENAMNTSIRIFNDSMGSTMQQLGGDKPFEPIATSNIFSSEKATRLEELRRKRDAN